MWASTTSYEDGSPFSEKELPGETASVFAFFRGRWRPFCMKDLVQLQRRHEDFAKRGVRVVVVSMEGTDDAKKTQAL